MSTQTAARHRRWFPAASHGRYEVTGVHAEWRPAAIVHAKQPGSAAAACGAVVANWQTFWELRFPRVEAPGVCDACQRAIVEDVASRPAPRSARD